MTDKNSIEIFDIVIVGGGITGALLAHMLSKKMQKSIRIALIDPAFKNNSSSDRAHDWSVKSRRVSAINSVLFEKLKDAIHQSLDHLAEPLKTMKVYTPEFGGAFSIDANDLNHDALAFVVENEVLNHMILDSLSEKIHLIDQTVINIERIQKGYAVSTNTSFINTHILIAADGARSILTKKLGLHKNSVGRTASAIAAQIRVPKFYSIKTARQWFLKDGSILGLLPVKQNNDVRPIMSMVWSLPQSILEINHFDTSHIKKLLLELVSFTAEYEEFKGFEFYSEPKIWPLNRGVVASHKMARDFPGLYLIGDAAHTIHPLAGQGLNLGLEDVFELAMLLENYFNKDDNLYKSSSCYHARRAFSVNSMMNICEGLKNNFEKTSIASKFLSSSVFNLFDQHYLIKNKVVKMMSF